MYKKTVLTTAFLFAALVLVGQGCSQEAKELTPASEVQPKQKGIQQKAETPPKPSSKNKAEQPQEAEVKADVKELEKKVEKQANEDLESDSQQQMKVVEVSGDEYSFSPSVIKLEKGQKVKIKFTNTGNISHNLKIPSLGMGTRTISAGETDSFTFTANKEGSHPIRFECTLPGHASQGMVGKIVVK